MVTYHLLDHSKCSLLPLQQFAALHLSQETFPERISHPVDRVDNSECPPCFVNQEEFGEERHIFSSCKECNEMGII